MKDHPLNRNRVIVGYYADKAVLWRAASTHYPNNKIDIEFRAFRIVAYTPCGAWITLGLAATKDRFVNLRKEKQYASASMDEAVEQLTYRKRAQVRILTDRLEEAHQTLALLKAGPEAWEAHRNYLDSQSIFGLRDSAKGVTDLSHAAFT